jgi:hypothetical protein
MGCRIWDESEARGQTPRTDCCRLVATVEARGLTPYAHFFSASASTLRAMRKHSTPTGTPA